MPAKFINDRNDILFVAVLLTTTAFLNLDFIHFHPLELWFKILPPALIGFGYLGTVGEVKILRYCGWAGIVMFMLISIFVSFPTEDYLLGEADDDHADLPRTVSNVNSLVRVTVGMVLTALLFWRY